MTSLQVLQQVLFQRNSLKNSQNQTKHNQNHNLWRAGCGANTTRAGLGPDPTIHNTHPPTLHSAVLLNQHSLLRDDSLENLDESSRKARLQSLTQHPIHPIHPIHPTNKLGLHWTPLASPQTCTSKIGPLAHNYKGTSGKHQWFTASLSFALTLRRHSLRVLSLYLLVIWEEPQITPSTMNKCFGTQTQQHIHNLDA